MSIKEPNGLIWAKQIVNWGWRVAPGFCSKTGEKVPLCGDWVQNATTKETQLEKWWRERNWLWPGTVSGLESSLVLDCDGPAAIESFRRLVGRNGGWIRGGLVYRTPGKGGGLHCVWDWPDFLGKDFRQAKVILSNNEGEIQLRGNGHWTLLCGAKRPDGEYTILEVPDSTYSREAPEQIIKAFLSESVVSTTSDQSSGTGELSELSPEDAWSKAPWYDGRKNALAGLSWHESIRGQSLDYVEQICISFGQECCVPPVAEETCLAKARYAHARAERFRQRTQEQAMRSVGYLLRDGMS